MDSIKAVFFDVGGTLLTPIQDEGATFSDIATRMGFEVDPVEVKEKAPQMYVRYEHAYEQDNSFWNSHDRAKGLWIELYEYMAALLGVPEEAHYKYAEAVYLFYFSPGAWKAFDDVLPMLDALTERGLRLGLISNWDSSLAAVIEGLDMTHYFETIIASADVAMHKPNHEIFDLALDRFGIEANEAMHVGDHLHADAIGANDAGLCGVLLDRKGKYPDFEGHRVASLMEILDILDL